MNFKEEIIMFLEKLTDRLEKLTFIDAFKLLLAVVAVVVVFRACTAGDGFDMPSQEMQDQQFYVLLDSAYKNFIDNTDDVWIPLYYIGEVSDGVAAVTQSIKDDVAAETYFVWGDVEEEFGHRLSKTVHS